MKKTLKNLALGIVLLAFTATAVMAQVSPGDINRLKGLIINAKTIVTTTLTATTLTLSGSGTADISPAFSTSILGNPVVKYAYGSCTVAAVNGGTCIPLTGVTARTISVLYFDIVAAGSAATCTGVKLEDTNGTPVVISTLAAATLTSGAHNIPLTATLGVGFGAGSGLTAAKGVQILVNGSGCTTTTAFQYAITYTVQ